MSANLKTNMSTNLGTTAEKHIGTVKHHLGNLL